MNNLEQNDAENRQFTCKYCDKIYTARNSLWYHEQKCSVICNNQTKNSIDDKEDLLFELLKQNKDTTDKDQNIIMMLIKENSEFKSMMLEQQNIMMEIVKNGTHNTCLLYTSPSPRDRTRSRMPSSA